MPSPERIPVIVLPFLAGGAALLAAVMLRSLWLAALPRTICPACREATSSVRYGPAALAPWIRRRWCTACGWSGWGRNGPVHRPDRPLAHDSGFHWGDDRMEPDFGFRWAEREPGGDESRPHPSGFRWATEDGATATAGAGADHPSGFRFRAGQEEEAQPETPGFRWGTTLVDPMNDFRWKS